jgi:hypothetical protein
MSSLRCRFVRAIHIEHIAVIPILFKEAKMIVLILPRTEKSATTRIQRGKSREIKSSRIVLLTASWLICRLRYVLM